MITMQYDLVISYHQAQQKLVDQLVIGLESAGLLAYTMPLSTYPDGETQSKHEAVKLFQSLAKVGLAVFSQTYFEHPQAKVLLHAMADKSNSYLMPVIAKGALYPQANWNANCLWAENITAVVQAVRQKLGHKEDGVILSTAKKVAKLGKGSLAEGIRQFKQYPSEQYALYHYRIGLFYYYSELSWGQLRLALHHFKRAFEINPKMHKAYYFYGKAYVKGMGMGMLSPAEIDKPIYMAEKALSLAPGTYEYQEFAKKIKARWDFTSRMKHLA